MSPEQNNSDDNNASEKSEIPPADSLASNESGIFETDEDVSDNVNDAHSPAPLTVSDQISALQQGFEPLDIQTEPSEDQKPITSILSDEPSIEYAQMVELEGTEGTIIYYPPSVPEMNIGDVLYLRERTEPQAEDGVIVQVIEKGTVSYPQASSKSLFRLMSSVHGHKIRRSHNEPVEIIDKFLSLYFKVRAAIGNGDWQASEGRVVTRNVDIFLISPQIVIQNIVVTDM